jgi:hypothetical protein
MIPSTACATISAAQVPLLQPLQVAAAAAGAVSRYEGVRVAAAVVIAAVLLAPEQV